MNLVDKTILCLDTLIKKEGRKNASALLGVSEACIGKWVNRKHFPSLVQASKILDVFGVKIITSKEEESDECEIEKNSRSVDAKNNRSANEWR